MLKKADIGVAMGNASDFVKSYANFATTSTYDNGIYNAVTKILKDEETYIRDIIAIRMMSFLVS